MINEAHIPVRSDSRGGRKLGDVKDRQAVINSQGGQNLSPGRYDVNEEKKKGTQRALRTASAKKGTETGSQDDEVFINPEKPIIGSGYN